MDIVHFIPEGQRKLAILLANSDSPTLIRGATGTGKGTVAAWIHTHSMRASKPLVYFTPTPQSQIGDWVSSLASAAGGTWVAENLQIWSPKDLKQLENIAKTKSLQHESLRILTQVRIIGTCMSATPLPEGLTQQFGSDLIIMPSLKERKKEFATIAAALIGELSTKLGKGFVTEMSTETLYVLSSYDWPGNIRELKQVLHFAIQNAKKPQILTSDLPPLFSAISMGLMTEIGDVPPLEKSIS